MYCRQCGSRMAQGTKFCSNCGAELTETEFTEQGKERQPKSKKWWPLVVAAVFSFLLIIGGWELPGTISVIAIPICFILLIVFAVRRKKIKPILWAMLVSVLCLVLCLLGDSLPTVQERAEKQCDRKGHEYCQEFLTEATCTEKEMITFTCERCGHTYTEEQGEALGHQWQAATCESAKTCTVCQTTEGAAPGHDVEEWHVIEEASCSQEGKQEGICRVCGERQTNAITKTEHLPGDWVVTKNATGTEDGERSKTCTVCGETVETESFELSEQEVEAAYKASCQSYSYNEIARNPGYYNGKYAKFTGEVVQVQQQDLYGIMCYVLRVNVTQTGSYYTYYEDTIYVTYYATEDEARILEDDIITMYGELTGEKTYETVLGASVTIPSFSAEYIDIN